MLVQLLCDWCRFPIWGMWISKKVLSQLFSNNMLHKENMVPETIVSFGWSDFY